MARIPESERVRRIWDRLAARYDRSMERGERFLIGGGREWVCSRARGDVLELSIGTGRNLPHYAPGLRLTGVDISPPMLDRARARAAALGREAELRVGDAQALELGDGTFDTVVFTLALCSIPEPRAAVAEARRVLRPGGRLLLLEHVRSPRPLVRAVQRTLDPVAVWLAGDHLVREPLELLAAEGFVVEELERARLGVVERVAARKPGGAAGPPRPSGGGAAAGRGGTV
ncbi:MAG TPA: class I SAM-dependent methyltransferase [Anaeromyxobacter sp.]|nr:class I SAM-dependent methyltransferase [Anaeromyxobacter sp.]